MVAKSKIFLISCSKTKLNYSTNAKNLYSASTLFKKSFLYAKLRAKQIYILSAKYGLINPNKKISPYNETLQNKTKEERLDWTMNVLDNLGRLKKLQRRYQFIFLCGNIYSHLIKEQLKKQKISFKDPLKGKGIGERLKWLTTKLNAQI